MNSLKTTLLLSLLTVLMVTMGGAIGGTSGMVFAFIMALGMNFFSYWSSGKIVLKMYGAQEIGEHDHPVIANPLTGGGTMSLFSTHLPMEDRIARLEGMATRTH
jgi:Zn-dependent protease with chaperone function